MKIERINENQIRCTLTSSDLSARNLNLGELAYGTEKAKKLFHEMIQKASNEVGFEADVNFEYDGNGDLAQLLTKRQAAK